MAGKTLPETRGEWKLGKPRTGAETWLRAGGEPVLAAWKAGAGRAAALGWPDHWRWARASPDGAEAYRRFFARLAGWLANREGAGDEKLALSLTRYRLRPGEEVSLLARLLKVPDAPLVELAARVGALGPAGEEARIGLSPAAPGVYRATLRGGAAGEYRAEVTARAGGAEWARAEVYFSVEGREVEAEDPTPDFAALSALAKATGGTFLGPADVERLPLLLRKSLPRPEPRLRRARTTLWDRVWYLGLALAAFCGAWAILRRSK